MHAYKQHMTGVLFSIIWSSAFIAGKVAIQDIDPIGTLFLRFLCCSLLLAPFCLRTGGRLTLAGLIGAGGVLGFLNNAVYLGLTFSALQYISPEWVIIIVSCSPFMTMALSVLRGNERFSMTKLAGLVIGFTGVIIMTGVTGLDNNAVAGLGMALGGTFAFSVGTVLFREKGKELPLGAVNFWMSLSAVILLAPWAVHRGLPLESVTLPGFAAIGWLVAVSLLGMALWLLLIRRYGAVTAASYHLLNPVSGLLLAFLVLGTPPNAHNSIGAATICLGLYIVSRGKKDATVPKAKKREQTS